MIVRVLVRVLPVSVINFLCLCLPIYRGRGMRVVFILTFWLCVFTYLFYRGCVSVHSGCSDTDLGEKTDPPIRSRSRTNAILFEDEVQRTFKAHATADGIAPVPSDVAE